MYMPFHAIPRFAICFSYIKVSTSCTAESGIKTSMQKFLCTLDYFWVLSSLLIIQISLSSMVEPNTRQRCVNMYEFSLLKMFVFIPRLLGCLMNGVGLLQGYESQVLWSFVEL